MSLSAVSTALCGFPVEQHKMGSCRVLVSRDPVIERGIEITRWHLSISHPTRYPKWDEIKKARYKLLPADITVAMILPPPSEYVNLHRNCFHLHEIPSEKEWSCP
mgnify:CR=1 FL=1